MVKMTIKLLDAGTKRTLYGSEQEMEAELRHLFPRETENSARLLSCIEAVNAEGFGEVEVEPYREPPERNLLAPDYDTQVRAEDPWEREGDK